MILLEESSSLTKALNFIGDFLFTPYATVCIWRALNFCTSFTEDHFFRSLPTGMCVGSLSEAHPLFEMECLIDFFEIWECL